MAEAEKLGFECAVIPKGNLKGVCGKLSIKLVEVGKIEDLMRFLFE